MTRCSFYIFAALSGVALCTQPAKAQPLTDNGILGQSVLNRPTIPIFYWSPTWNASNPSFPDTSINSFVFTLMDGQGAGLNNYFTKALQYSDSSGNVLVPSAVTAGSPATTSTCFGLTSPPAIIDSLTFTSWVHCMLTTGGIAAVYPPNFNAPDILPLILLPTGSTINNDISITIPSLVLALISPPLAILYPSGLTFSKTIPSACREFYGYHFWTAPFVDIFSPPFIPNPLYKLREPYAVVPLQCFAPGGGLSGDASGFYTQLDDASVAISHELVEGVTDPFVVFGWIDLSKGLGTALTDGEAGDICAISPRNPNVWYQDQMVAAYWSNFDSNCVAGTGTLSTLTLTATFANPADTPPNVLFSLDSRLNKKLTPAGFSFPIQVVTEPRIPGVCRTLSRVAWASAG